jgi:hypothetical protein
MAARDTHVAAHTRADGTRVPAHRRRIRTAHGTVPPLSVNERVPARPAVDADPFAEASSGDTPPARLAELSRDAQAAVRARVAANPATPTRELAVLARDHHPTVAAHVGANPSADDVTLAWLARDGCPIVSRPALERLETLGRVATGR